MDYSKFSDDMKMEILSRTSLKTLDTMRCTSQELQKLTYDSYFLNQLYYNNKQRNSINDDMVVSGFLLLNLQKGCEYTTEFASSHTTHTLDLGFLPPKSRILASSEQGIIVFESPHQRYHKLVSYHVCKPATKQVFTLPNPKTRYLTKNVAMVVVGSNPFHYKIIRLSEPKRHKPDRQQYTKYRYEVFDSKSWAWRLLDPVKLPYSVFLSNEQPIATRGSIYMTLTNNEVLKFEASSEKWAIFSPPPIDQTFDDAITIIRKKLVKYKGKLGFICETPTESAVWVVRGDDSWEKLDDLESREAILLYDSDTMSDDYKTLHAYQIFAFRSDFEPI